MIKKKKEEAPAAKPKAAAGPAYLVKFDGAPDLVGVVKAVKFIHGHGVLDAVAIVQARPEYLDKDTGALTPDGLFTLKALAEYWEKRAKVEEVSEAVAAAYRAKLEKDPTGHVPKKAKVEEAPKEKTKSTRGAGAGQAPPHKQPKE